MHCSYFISDLHLTTERPGITAALATFLRLHGNCEALYILGDLFEAWIGDDDDSELATRVRRLLSAFTGGGPKLYIMHGNRDFLLGERFCRAVGARLLPDPSVIDLYGRPTLLLHGDSLCVEDAEYQAFRRKVRHPDWQADVLARTLEERRALAADMRQASGALNSNKREDIMDASPAEVARVMDEHGVDHMIHGHTHRPAQHREPSGSRWVLGDWDRRGWALKADDSGMNLFNFYIDQLDI